MSLRAISTPRPRTVLGLGLLALALFALPATAQDLLPRCFQATDAVDYCAVFGLAFDRESCQCRPFEIDWSAVNGIYDLCDLTPTAANDFCRSRGMYFNPVECRCMAIRLVPNVVLPEIPQGWWDQLPDGVVVPKDDRLRIHRGEGLFIETTFESFQTGLDLMLEGASVEDIQAQGFEVTPADSP